MARIASQARMGYYPTPPVVVNHLKKSISLSVGEGTYRLLDTCCGEGEALDLLAGGLGPGVETYGAELDETRVKKTSQRLNHVVWGDALTELRVSIRAFSLLWLNPPYDWSAGGSRLEARFLESHLKFIQPKGWLIFVIPHVALKFVKGSLSRLSQLQIYAFPEEEFGAFKQLVVVGQKSPTAKSAEQLAMIEELAWLLPAKAWEKLPKTSEIPQGSIVLPPSPAGRVTFASDRSDMEKAAELAGKSTLWKEFEAITASKTLQNIRPLAPLRQGHLAMLLAGGMMNGEVESNGRRLVIKGSVKKGTDSTTETTETHVIFRRREKFQIVIRAIDLDKKEIFAIC